MIDENKLIDLNENIETYDFDDYLQNAIDDIIDDMCKYYDDFNFDIFKDLFDCEIDFDDYDKLKWCLVKHYTNINDLNNANIENIKNSFYNDIKECFENMEV